MKSIEGLTLCPVMTGIYGWKAKRPYIASMPILVRRSKGQEKKGKRIETRSMRIVIMREGKRNSCCLLTMGNILSLA
jgi:hypothetical protein